MLSFGRISIEEGKVKFALQNWSRDTRVHLVANSFLSMH